MFFQPLIRIIYKIMTTKEKIMQFLDFKQINKRDFYRQTGLSNGFLDSGKHIGSDNLKIIIDTFPEINLEWLVMDLGEMILNNLGSKNDHKNDHISEPKPNIQKTEDMNLGESHGMTGIDGKKKGDKTTTNHQSIPLIPIDAMAGYGNGEIPVCKNDLIDSYVVPEFEEKGVKYIIRVSGSSMYPKYGNGDLLGCKPIKDLSFFQWGKPYVLDTDQGAMVKRLYPVPDNDEVLECRSDNERYPPFPIRKESIYRIAIVVGVIRLE